MRRAETWTGGPQLITRLASAGLWTMLAAGPVALAGVVVIGLAPQPRPVVQPVEVAGHDARTAVAEFAQRLVVDWLQTPRGREERIEAYGLLDLATRQPDTAQRASFPAVTRAAEVKSGLWSVTVGVTVTDPAGTAADPDEAFESAGDPATDDQVASEDSGGTRHRGPMRQYFQVSVEYRDGLLAAQTLPAAVPAPPAAGHSRLGYTDTVDPRDSLGEAVRAFLSALLTGTGDVSRYTTGDSGITAVDSQPYVQVEVTEIRADDAPDPGVQPVDGDEVQVLATALALTRAQQQIAVQYPLTLIARPGRWEVVEIAPVARRAGPDAQQ